MDKKTAVMYGAGNIGRGFIGQVFVDSGFEVVFIDINGDGLPDWVRKTADSEVIEVAFNMGSAYTEFQSFPLSNWGRELRGKMGSDNEPLSEGFSEVPYFGSVDASRGSELLGTLNLSGIDALDYSFSDFWG